MLVALIAEAFQRHSPILDPNLPRPARRRAVARRVRVKIVLACATLLVLTLVQASIVRIARADPVGAGIATLVVKYRDQALSDPASLPPALRDELANALGGAFSVTGRTRDGAFELTLAKPLAIDDARAALNRVRQSPEVLYVQVQHATPAASAQLQSKSAAALPPVRALIVKYKDPLVQAAAAANRPLPAAQLNEIGAAAGQPVAFQRNLAVGAALVRLLRVVTDPEAVAIASVIAQNPAVEYAEPDRMRFPTLTPNDPVFASQWDLMGPGVEVGGANLPPAWDVTVGSASINIAVIDTGILPHPDLAGRYIGGYDFISDFVVANDNQPTQPAACFTTHPINPLAAPCINDRDPDPTDPGDWISQQDNQGLTFDGWLKNCPVANSSFHGTHVSGTIAAASNNGMGVAGINWMSHVIPLRALGKCGGYTSDINDAIVWAVNGTVPGIGANPNPARVINMSLGGAGPCLGSDQTAINAALAANASVVIAAGNDNDDASGHSPGNCNGVITVAATQRQGYKANYSNFGNTVEISAPGGGAKFPNGSGQDFIFSTLNDVVFASPPGTGQAPNPAGYDYVGYQGTSMATPHVAGIASLILSANASLTPAQVLAKLQASVRPFPTGGPTCAPAPPDPNQNNWYSCQCTTALCGAGLIDAGRALQAVIGAVTTTVVTSSQNPAPQGASVTLTATVTGINPTGPVGFADAGTPLAGCTSVNLTGSGDSPTAQCTTSTLAMGNHPIVATYAGDGNNKTSVSATFQQSIGTGTTGINVALKSNGGNVLVTSTLNQPPYVFGADALNDGDHKGTNWSTQVANGGWQDATYNQYPDAIQIDFNAVYTLDHVVLYTLQDNFGAPVEPSDTMTFSLYGVTDFFVQGWDGANWVTLATVNGNNLVKRTVNFSPFSTSNIRVFITGALAGFSRLTEVEAWTVPGGGGGGGGETNWALASNGGNVLVTSTLTQPPYVFGAAALNDGDRRGENWSVQVQGGGWMDGSYNQFPDALQIDLNGVHTIDKLIVYTLQDNFTAPVEPTDTMTFSLYGVTDFFVQHWDGTTWITDATVVGNNLVKRTVSLPNVQTANLRVFITGGMGGFSRLVEVEAFGP